MIKLLTTWLALVLMVSGCGLVQAQSTLPPIEDLDKAQKRAVIKLDGNDCDLAHDYEDLLEQMERLILDYDAYFSDLEQDQAEVCRGALFDVMWKLERGDYYIDAELLLDDITRLEARLIDRERELRGSDNRELYRLVRSLRREVEMIDDIAREDIFTDEDQLKRLPLIQAFLLQEKATAKKDEARVRSKIIAKKIEERLRNYYREAMPDPTDKKVEIRLKEDQLHESESRQHFLEEHEQMRKRLQDMRERIEEYKERLLLYMPEESVLEIVNLVEALGDDFLIGLDSTAYIFNVPDIKIEEIEIPPVPRLPELPEAPVIVYGPSDRTFVRVTGQAGRSKEFIDSISVSDSNLPIFVNNQSGRLRVQGWDEDMVKIRFDVEVAAKDPQMAEEFIGEIQVRLYKNDRGVYITSDYPDISDPKRRVISSFLDISVPSVNRLVCDNSFGAIEVSDLEEGLKVNATKCDLTLKDIEGGIQAVNSMGPTTVYNSTDFINVRNSMGPVKIIDCDAEFQIDNSYAAISMSGCEGEAIIRNTGEIRLTDHDGDIEIENSGGPVYVKDITGKLGVKSSYKTINISDIVGPVIIEAANSDLNIRDIDGKLDVTNHAGSIVAIHLAGSFHLSNHAGQTFVTLRDRPEGPSSITADGGSITLKVSDDSDVIITAETVGGSIISSLASTVRRRDMTSTVEIMFGQADIPLNVSGHSTSITILPAK